MSNLKKATPWNSREADGNKVEITVNAFPTTEAVDEQLYNGPWPLTEQRLEEIEHKIDLAETRKSSLESLSAVTTFISGFAIVDLASFNASDYPDYRGHLYCGLMGFVVATSTFIAIVGIFIVFAITSIQLHDKSYLHKFKEMKEEKVMGGSDVYMLVNDLLGYDFESADGLKQTNEKKRPESERYEKRRKRFPYCYTFMMGTCDFAQWPSWWPTGKSFEEENSRFFWRGNAYCKALLILPLSIVAYLAAVVISATKDAPLEIVVGLTVVITGAAVPMVRVCDQYIQIALY